MTNVSRARTFLDALAGAIEGASSHNKQDQVPPAAVLWTDEARQWEELLPLTQGTGCLSLFWARTPQGEHTGPAYWLRCIIARTITHPGLPGREGARALPARLLPTGYAGVGDLSCGVAATWLSCSTGASCGARKMAATGLSTHSYKAGTAGSA